MRDFLRICKFLIDPFTIRLKENYSPFIININLYLTFEYAAGAARVSKFGPGSGFSVVGAVNPGPGIFSWHVIYTVNQGFCWQGFRWQIHPIRVFVDTFSPQINKNTPDQGFRWHFSERDEPASLRPKNVVSAIQRERWFTFVSRPIKFVWAGYIANGKLELAVIRDWLCLPPTWIRLDEPQKSTTA